MQTGDELMNRWYVLAFGTRAILVIIGSGKTQCLKAIAQVVSSEFADSADAKEDEDNKLYEYK